MPNKMNALLNRSALRSLAVFESFRQARKPILLSEIARLTDIPVSTCHGVVRALLQSGFLYSMSSKELYPTRKLWELARQIDARDPVVSRLEPDLTALRDATGETVILGTRHGDTVVYLLVIESGQSIRYSSRAGEIKPLHSSSIGKTMLGALDRAALDRWLAAAHTLPRITDRTITTAQRLKKDLEASRTRGYYVTRGENVVDVMAIAAPLRVGTQTFGVAIAGPMHRMDANEPRLVDSLQQCVQGLEEREIQLG